MNQHFKKRKARSSSAPVSPRRAAATTAATTITPTTSLCSASASTANDHFHTSSRSHSPVPTPIPAPLAAEGINLSAALTALKVSLKREMETFLPPTPAASPIHARSAKRPRFEFAPIIPDLSESKTHASTRPKASPVPKPRGTAFLSVSKKLQQELERTARPDSSDGTLRARKRRQQLSYFAIASAFHRAAHDRGLALVPATQVGE